jgi:hypothetical protein
MVSLLPVLTLVTLHLQDEALQSVARSSSDPGVTTRASLQFQRSGDRWLLQEVTLDGTAHVLSSGELDKELVKERLSVEAQPSMETMKTQSLRGADFEILRRRGEGLV